MAEFELDAVTAVDLDLAGVVDPRHAEHDHALGLDETLEKSGLLVLGVRIDTRLKGTENLGRRLEELRLLRVTGLKLVEDPLSVRHRRLLSCAI